MVVVAIAGCQSSRPCVPLPTVIAPPSVAMHPHDSADVELVTALGSFPTGTRVSIDHLQNAFSSDPATAAGPAQSIYVPVRSTGDATGLSIDARLHVEACSGSFSLPIELKTLQKRGGLNPGFGSNGAVSIDLGDSVQSVRALAFDRSGRILVGGIVGSGFQPQDMFVTRLLRNGTPDPTFQTSRVDFGAEDFLESIAVMDDGRIIVGGSRFDPYGTEQYAFLRLLPDGGLDPSFGTAGLRLIDLGAGVQEIQGILPRDDGTLLAIGASNALALEDVVTLRLTSSGELDPTFEGGSGYHEDVPPAQLGGFGNGRHLVVQGPAYGNRVVVGVQGGGFALLGLHPDGSLDPTFGVAAWGGSIPDMTVTPPFGVALAAAPDGSLWTTGTDNAFRLMLGHYLPNGAPDSSLSWDGVLHSIATGFDLDKTALGVRPDGRILSVGQTFHGGGEAVTVYEFLPDGSPDLSFGTDPGSPGAVFTTFPGMGAWAQSLLIGDDGTFYIGGYVGDGATTTGLVVGYLQ